MKIVHGIVEFQNLIDPKRRESLKERDAESKKELLQYCYNPAWMKNGGRILRFSCLMGKHFTNGNSANHSKDP